MSYNFNTTLNKTRIDKILSMCKKTPINAYDIADTLCMRPDVTRGFITYMLDSGLIYICEFKQIGRHWVRFYLAGNKKSANIDDYAGLIYMTSKQKKAMADSKRYKEKKNLVQPKKARPDIAASWMLNPIN